MHKTLFFLLIVAVLASACVVPPDTDTVLRDYYSEEPFYRGFMVGCSFAYMKHAVPAELALGICLGLTSEVVPLEVHKGEFKSWEWPIPDYTLPAPRPTVTPLPKTGEGA